MIPPKPAVAGIEMRLKLDEDVDAEVKMVAGEEGAAVVFDGAITTTPGKEDVAVDNKVEVTGASEIEAFEMLAELADIVGFEMGQRGQRRESQRRRSCH